MIAARAALDEVRRTDDPSTEQASRALCDVAEAVVRPLSHRLADDDAWNLPPDSTPPAGAVPGRTRSVLAALQPVAPLGPVLLLEGAGLPFMLTRLGLQPALLNLIIGGTVLYVATAFVHRRGQWSGGAARRVIGLVLAAALLLPLLYQAVKASESSS